MQNMIKLGLVFLMFIGVSVYAQNDKITLSTSYVGMSMDYTEYSDGTAIDSEKSSFNEIYGVDMGISYLLSNNLSSYSEITSNLMVIGGNTVYRGSLLGSGDPIGTVVSTTVNTIIDFDINYLRNYKVHENVEFKYAFGVGYRYWKRSLSASQEEVYTWYSLRPMIGASYHINNKLHIGLDLEYQYGIYPVMNESTYGDFTLGGADIIEVSIPISYQYNEKMEIFFEYTYQEQTIKKSNVVSGLIEPDSTANNQYIKLGMAFKF